MPVYFGEKIKRERKRLGLTQKQLAEKLGVKNTTVSNWEKDLNRPDADMVELLCGIFGITVGELYGGRNEKDPAAESSGISDELMAFYGEVKDMLDDDDKADLMALMRIRAELKNKRCRKLP